MATLVPALNASSEREFVERARILRTLEPPWVQVDVADGRFGVPKNVAYPALAERELLGLRLDIHLMVQDVSAAVAAWGAIAPGRMTVHCEVLDDPAAALADIRSRGSSRGLALGPETLPDRVAPHLRGADFLLFVAVPPGRSGQAFDARILERIRAVRAENPSLDIGVDGGVISTLVPDLLKAGATTICAASAIFRAPDPVEAYWTLKRLVEL